MPGRPKLLIVEDNADIREAVVALLRMSGRRVVEAANGRLGLDALDSREQFGAVILDLRMPVMDGPAFLEHKAKGRQAAVPVVVFTSSDFFDGCAKYSDVAAVVQKPAGIEALLGGISRAERAKALP